MQHRTRWSITTVAAAALTLLSACADDAPVGSVSAMRITTTAPVAAPATSAAPGTAPATVPGVDPVALIGAGIDGLAVGYHFRTTVTLNGGEVLVAEGDRVGDGTRLTVTRTGGAAVDYVIMPAGSWVRPSGGEWDVAAADTPATTDPIAALRTPSAASVTSVDGAVTTIVATVPALSLGVAAEGDATVQITLDGSTLRDVTYSAPLDGRTAVLRTVLGPVADATAVVAPI